MSGKSNGLILTTFLCALALLPNAQSWAQSWTQPPAQPPAQATAPNQNAPTGVVRADLIQDSEPTPASELEVYLASANMAASNLAMQPALRTPSMSTNPRSSVGGGSSSRGARPPSNRLASAPEMFGDFFMSGGNLNFRQNNNSPGLPPTSGSFTIPSAGGSRRVKIAENNKAMPDDRLIFSYNHFENALQFTEGPANNPAAALTRSFPIDRYTFGVEKTFVDGLWSCELRMPFQGEFSFQGQDQIGTGGQVGNLAVILKHLLHQDESLAIVAGLGIDIPTGSDFQVVDQGGGVPATLFTFQNDSLHLLPYLGFLCGGSDLPYFVNGFVQVDIATAGNRVDAGPVGGQTATLGLFNEQNLLFVDLGTGYWLYRDEANEQGLTSLAAILEFHYTTSLQDTDFVVATVGGRPINYRNNFNRFDVTNVTTGVQAQLFNNTSVRVAGVFPLSSGDDRRFFDSEVQVQVNRRF